MIDNLIEYGILGLWTASLIIDKWRFQRDMTKAINKLTNAIKEKF